MADTQNRKRLRRARKPLLAVSGKLAISADEITRYLEASFYGEEDSCLLAVFFHGYSTTTLLPWNVLFRLWLVRMDSTTRKADNDDCSALFASESILPKVLVSLKADALLFRDLMPVSGVTDNNITADLMDVDPTTNSKAMIRNSCWSRDRMLLSWKTHQRRHVIRNLKDHGAHAELQHSEQLCLLAVIQTIDEICSRFKAVDGNHSLLIDPNARDVPIQSSSQSTRDDQQGKRDDQVAANRPKEEDRIELFHNLNVEMKVAVKGDNNSLRLADFIDSLVIYCQGCNSEMGDELESILLGLCQRTWNAGEIRHEWVSSIFRHFCSQDTPEASLTLKEFHINLMIYNQSRGNTCLVDAIMEEFYGAVSHDSSDMEVDRIRNVSDFVIRMTPAPSLFLGLQQFVEPLLKALKVFTNLNRHSEVLGHLFVAFTLRLDILSNLAQGEGELTAANVLARYIFLARVGLLSVARSCQPGDFKTWCRQVYEELEGTVSSARVIVLWREITLNLIFCYESQTVLMDVSFDSPTSHFVSQLLVMLDELISTDAPGIERIKRGLTNDGQENGGAALVCSRQQLLDQLDTPFLPRTGLAHHQRGAASAMDTAVLAAMRRRQTGVLQRKSLLGVSVLPTANSSPPRRQAAEMRLSDDDFIHDGGGGVNESVHSEEDAIDAESDDEILLLDL